jgi:tetratricopeptide (TPR) repeat protein
MSIAQLKKKAADFELKKQFDKAIQVYIQILNGLGTNVEEVDLALFNRVGDLLLRQGNVADALDYYERAVDRYADGGFFNNAIALCNKILRHSPGRATVYYKLGKISAHKGFTNDAKQNFLEYADRMQKSGRMDEAFRALKEFADLCPDQHDIRLMLADQLSKQNKAPEALEQLQLVYDAYQDEGKESEAQATIARMKAIDPSFRPRTSGSQRRQKSSGLVFLDLGAEEPPKLPPPAPSRRSEGPDVTGGLPMLDTGEDPTPPPSREPPRPAVKPAAKAVVPPPRPAPRPAPPTPPADDVAPPRAAPPEPARDAAPDPSSEVDPEAPAPTGFESTSFSPPAAAVSPAELLGIERTAFEEPASGPPPLDTLPTEPAPKPDADGVGVGGPGTGIDFIAGAGFNADPPAPAATPAAEPEPTYDSSLDPSATAPAADLTSSFDFGNLNLTADGSGSSPGGGSSLDISRDTIPFDGMRVIDLDAPVSSAFGNDVAMPLDFQNATNEGIVIRDIELGEPGQSTLAAAQSVEAIGRALEENPSDHAMRRRLGEAMLESGDRAGAVRELEAAMAGFERVDDLDSASSLADEIARLTPEAVRIHQKRVEYAFRTNDKTRLVAAYLDLGQSLSDSGQPEKARAVYQRVLDLSPDDLRAQVALSALADAVPAPTAPAPPPVRGGPSPVSARPRATPARAQAAQLASSDFVNLGDLLRDPDEQRSTRIVVPEHEPTGDEEADFAEMLRRFKQGIAESVDAADYESHYDLGVAYKEMGLVDEAIAEFQKALRGPSNRLASYEALGQCFVEKGQFAAASALLGRALAEPGVTDDKAIGVLYLLGRAAEELRRDDEAHGYYQRVMVMDIEFRDVAKRLSTLERPRR